MKHTIHDFLNNEMHEMKKNIARIEHHLAGRDLNNPALAGQMELLDIQRQHLNFIQGLDQRVNTYDEAISACRQMIFDNEELHRQLSNRETLSIQRHSAQWWQSLHQVQYGSDFLNRIRSWQQNNAD